MKLPVEKLHSTLEEKITGFYFCSGNDIFLVNEFIDKIITAAKKQAFNEVLRLYVDKGFSWEKLYTTLRTPSLFSPKIAIILQLNDWKLELPAKTLLTESSQAKINNLLVIVKGPKVERATSNSPWFQAMTKIGYWLDIPALYPSQVPAWLQQHAAGYGLKLTREAAQKLAQHTENNLTAAVQAIEKLQLLNLPITPTVITEVVELSAEYDMFKLIEACLGNNAIRSYQVFFSLKNNHAEPLMIIGAWAKELRLIREIMRAQLENISLKTAAQRLGIWESRLALMQNFMRAYQAIDCQYMLAQLARLDAITKGALSGNIWQELLVFCMKIATKQDFSTPHSTSLIG